MNEVAASEAGHASAIKLKTRNRHPTAWSRALVNTRMTMTMMRTGTMPMAQVLTDEEPQKWTNK
jgi:hypothetical protein